MHEPEIPESSGVKNVTKTVLKSKYVQTNKSPPKIIKQVQFVGGGELKLNSKIDEIETSLVKPVDQLPAKVGSCKAFNKKRSCFTCHKKGHVASVFPQRKGKTSYQSIRKANSPEKSSISHIDKIADNRDRTGLGYHDKSIFQRSQPRFYPHNNQSRSKSPSLSGTSGSSTGSNQQRYFTPHRSNTPSRTNTPRRNHTPKRFTHRYPNTQKGVDTNVTKVVSAKFSDINSPTVGSKVLQNLGSTSQKPASSDGYLWEFSFVDEKGRLKTVMAWVPNEN